MSAELDHVRALQLMQQRKRECLNSAVLDGCVSASISLAVAGGLSYWLQKSSPVSGGWVLRVYGCTGVGRGKQERVSCGCV